MEIKVTPVPEEKRKIVTPYAKIMLSDYSEKPYWNIHYLDPTDGEIHIGFGSYYRKNVEEWLESEFEVYDVQKESPNADTELRAALSDLAKAVLKKYPDTVKAYITLDGGCAEMRIEQDVICDYCRGH